MADPKDPRVTSTHEYDPKEASPSAPGPVNPKTGQHTSYWVLTEEERAKGFVRPLRRSYMHVGARPVHPVRDLTEEEKKRYAKWGYVKFEIFPESESPTTGRFWSEERLKGGCGTVTTMSQAIAETYAAEPGFYGATFCAGCCKHLPVEEFVWMKDENPTKERVGS